MGSLQAACSGRWGPVPWGTAVLQLLWLAALAAALAAPTVAAKSINSMACPTGANIINVDAPNDLYEVYAHPDNGPGKTYVLAPGSYEVSQTLFFDIGITTPLTTCFIGGGARAEVVVTTPPGSFVFTMFADAPNPALGLGLKGLILDGAGTGLGVLSVGDSAALSIEDVTFRNGTADGLYTDSNPTELANVTFEHIQGNQAVVSLYGTYSASQWRDLAVTDCNTGASALTIGGANVTIEGLLLARNRANQDGGALYVDGAQVNFTGDVIIEGNEVTTDLGGGAYFRSATVRFTESSTLLVQNNVARQRKGGGFFLDDTSVVSILGSGKFINNTAGDVGGAVYLRSTSRMDMGSVCIQQNVAAGDAGSGIYLADSSTVTFTSPADAQMGDNVPAGSSIFVEAGGASWTCSGSSVTRGAGVYEVQGPVCACTDAAAAGGSTSCSCPATGPSWDPAACACKVECEPGSGPCCSEFGQSLPCIRSLVFVPNNIIGPACDGVELLVVVTDTAPAGSSPLGQPTETAPAVDVPVVFSVSGDCEPSVQARTVRTDAQGRARVRVTSQGPGVATVVAAVASGGSLRRPVVLATSQIKFLPCHKTGRKHAYDVSDGDNKDDYGRRSA